MKNTFLPRPWLLILGATLTAACATLATRLRPDLADYIKVPHSKHVEAGVSCDTCHEKILTATALGSSLYPTMETCGQCHDVGDDKTCGMCHALPDSPEGRTRADRHLNFPHQKHLANPDIKGDCGRCHTELPDPSRPPPTQSPVVGPAMAVCTGCHNHSQDFDEGRCSKCHQDLTRFALKPLTEFSHQGDWLKQHSLSARTTVVCAQCHEQTFCADCHGKTEAARAEIKFPERVDRLFVHRGDFISRHTIEAKADDARCLRCHGVTFCQSCHANQGLTPQGSSTVNPHPPGWAFPGPASHAVDARHDIVRCAACHDQGAASICTKCHQVGGVGGNPHPNSWLGHHRHDEINHNSMCLACHP